MAAALHGPLGELVDRVLAVYAGWESMVTRQPQATSSPAGRCAHHNIDRRAAEPIVALMQHVNKLTEELQLNAEQTTRRPPRASAEALCRVMR